MKVINMGPTSMGNPFLMVIITAPANFAKLERLREVNLRLSDPRGITEAQARAWWTKESGRRAAPFWRWAWTPSTTRRSRPPSVWCSNTSPTRSRRPAS